MQDIPQVLVLAGWQTVCTYRIVQSSYALWLPIGLVLYFVRKPCYVLVAIKPLHDCRWPPRGMQELDSFLNLNMENCSFRRCSFESRNGSKVEQKRYSNTCTFTRTRSFRQFVVKLKNSLISWTSRDMDVLLDPMAIHTRASRGL
jgi:hypothetical protein